GDALHAGLLAERLADPATRRGLRLFPPDPHHALRRADVMRGRVDAQLRPARVDAPDLLGVGYRCRRKLLRSPLADAFAAPDVAWLPREWARRIDQDAVPVALF